MERLERISPGLTTALAGTVREIKKTLGDLRTATGAQAHDSLSAAIAWRREAQTGLKLSRLTNEGFAIEHDDPRLKVMPSLQKSIADIEMAVRQQEAKPKREEVLAILKSGYEASSRGALYRMALNEAMSHATDISQKIDRCRTARSSAADRLEKVEAHHVARMKGGFWSRLLYRFGDRRKVLEEIESRTRHIAALDRAVHQFSARWKETDPERRDLARTLEKVSDQIGELEKRIDDADQAGDLSFLPPSMLEKLKRLNPEEWMALANAASEELRDAGKLIERGHAATQLFRSIAAQGIGDLGRTEKDAARRRHSDIAPASSERAIEYAELEATPTPESYARMRP